MTQYQSPVVKAARLPVKIARHLVQHGPRHAIDWSLYQLQWRWRERRLGINTREYAHGVVVDDRADNHGYEPIDHRAFDIILERLPLREGHDVLLDYGCGMGRAVVLAATREYRAVIGVEYDSRLVEIARKNVSSARSRGKLLAERVEIIEADATQWPVPHDVTHVFLFNSFVGQTLQTVLQQIYQSLRAAPRPLTLVYTIPVSQRDELPAVPWLESVGQWPTGFWNHIRTLVYQARGIEPS